MTTRTVGFIIEIKGTNVEQRELAKLTGELIKTTENTAKLRKAAKAAGGQNKLFNASLARSELRQKNLRKRIGETTRAIQQQSGQFKKAGGLFTSVNKSVINSFQQVGAAVGIAFGAALFVNVIKGAIDVVKDFDDAVADLRKVTGLSEEEATDLAVAVSKIKTTTSVQELLKLATAAGRLALEGEEIIEFTREVDKAFVALGDSLEGDAEEIGLTLGKLAANFDLEKKFGIGKAINKVGSSLNELGAQSKAQEKFIIDFTKRLSGVAVAAQIALPDLQALGALFDETGQSVEISATTFNKLLPAIGKDVEGFAKIAGVEVTKFREIVEKDAFAALKLVAEGAKSNQDGLSGLAKTLQNYGIESARAASIVNVLSQNTDRLTELQEIANKAFDEGTSLSEEFAIKTDTLRGDTDKLSKAYDEFIISIDSGNGPLSQAIRSILQLGVSAFESLGKVKGSISSLVDESIVFRGAIEFTVAVIKTSLQALFVPFEALTKAAITLTKTLFLAVSGNFKEAFETAKQGARDVVDVFVDFGKDAGERFTNAFTATISDVITEGLDTTDRIVGEIEKRRKRLEEAAKKRQEEIKNSQKELTVSEEKELAKRQKQIDAAIKKEKAARKKALDELQKLREDQIAEAVKLATETGERERIAIGKQIILGLEQEIKKQEKLEAVRDKSIELEEDRLTQLLAAGDLTKEERILAEQETQVKIQEIKDKFAEDEKVKREERTEEQRAQEEFALQAFQEGLNLVGQISAISRDKDLKDIQDNSNKQQKVLDDRLKAGIITQTQFDDQTAALEEKTAFRQEQVQRSALNREKGLSLTQTAINTAQAIGKAIAIFGPPPSPPGIAAIAAASIIGATQAGIILAQKFHTGGRVDGTFDGKDDIPILVSGDETIVTPSQRALLGGADAFRAAGVPGFQAGGAIGAPPNILPPSIAAANAGSTGAISRQEAVELLTEGLNNIKVGVLESEITTVQKRVAVLEAD